MDKMKFESPDITAENIDKIAALFPNVMTESKDQDGKLHRAVNFDMLRALLGDDVARDEAYEFTWVGKREAVMEAGRPIRKTLRPCMEESKNWDTTENLYIEGDNLDVLKLLQESYLGKVKMIYIDPPYNTGNDFIYRDNFKQDREEYKEDAGAFDENGDRLFRNAETNGRFHSDWCSMIYPRLVLARNLLRDDGVIFISIDDNEVAQLRKISDEVFGEENFVDVICWKKKYGGGAKEKYLVSVHEYILFYCRNKSALPEIFVDFPKEKSDRFYKFKDENYERRGCYRTHPLEAVQSFDIRENLRFGIKAPDGSIVYPKRQWRWGKERFEEALLKNEVIFSKNRNDEWVLSSKQYINDEDGTRRRTKAQSIIDDVFTQEGTQEIKEIFGDAKIFPFPKPVRFIEKLLEIAGIDENSIVLDFFSGSSATAHSLMDYSKKRGIKCRYIMVQYQENIELDSEADVAGYKNICEIGKERIRRAGEKIKEENKSKEGIETLDIGFRVLKLDESNMEDVYYSAGEYTQQMLLGLESNIKEDRTDMDLLYGCLLDWGLPLSMPHTQEVIDGVTVHTYNGGDLIACFADRVSETVVKEIASRKPLRAVFKDSSFSSSAEKINVEEIFKLMAPGASVKVL